MGAVMEDWRTAGLCAEEHALCLFAEKLTKAPGALEQADIEDLRRAGFDDEAVHDAIQIVSYFNYINRVADAVHVDLEPEMPPYPAG
ncbi:MAG: peroxidase [Planctomycetota bacterium]|nr:peroxidase [Planctomycetota bacterium]MDP6520078.1 peroxidase [Planctomycetota bacterium]MDP6839238.1 peroxidase [Planctomycetota bacterium]MDP6956380.1 peroxidase [Planctomycetota bacterium]